MLNGTWNFTRQELFFYCKPLYFHLCKEYNPQTHGFNSYVYGILGSKVFVAHLEAYDDTEEGYNTQGMWEIDEFMCAWTRTY